MDILLTNCLLGDQLGDRFITLRDSKILTLNREPNNKLNAVDYVSKSTSTRQKITFHSIHQDTSRRLEFLILGPFDQSFGRPVQVQEFGKQVFFQLELPALPSHVNLVAQFDDTIHIRHFVEHNPI